MGRFISILVVLVGCGDRTGQGEDDETSSSSTEDATTTVPVVEYVAQIQPIWNAQCTCHLQGMSGTMVAPTLTLNEQVSYDELVGMPSMAVPGLVRVAPGDPDASYLWHKIYDTQGEVGGNGTEMPPGAELPEGDAQLVEDWIRGGAMP